MAILLIHLRIVLGRADIDALTLALIGIDEHYLVQPGREVAGSIRRIALCYIPVEKRNYLPAVEIRRIDAPLCLGLGRLLHHIQDLAVFGDLCDRELPLTTY